MSPNPTNSINYSAGGSGEKPLSLDAALKLLSVMGKSGLKSWWSNAPAECKSADYVEKLMTLHNVFGESEFKRMLNEKFDCDSAKGNQVSSVNKVSRD